MTLKECSQSFASAREDFDPRKNVYVVCLCVLRCVLCVDVCMCVSQGLINSVRGLLFTPTNELAGIIAIFS